MFDAFFQLGIRHITDLEGYDHMLFLAALCANYTFRQWRQVLILVTAFTLGHSITLALATVDLLGIAPKLVELLIACTILLTCSYNLYLLPHIERDKLAPTYLKYGMALFFGLIHGMGFSNFLRSLLLPSQAIGIPLLAFNLGIEVGQIVVVLLILLIGSIFVQWRSLRDWSALLTGAALIPAIWMIFERL